MGPHHLSLTFLKKSLTQYNFKSQIWITIKIIKYTHEELQSKIHYDYKYIQKNHKKLFNIIYNDIVFFISPSNFTRECHWSTNWIVIR